MTFAKYIKNLLLAIIAKFLFSHRLFTEECNNYSQNYTKKLYFCGQPQKQAIRQSLIARVFDEEHSEDYRSQPQDLEITPDTNIEPEWKDNR